MIGVCILRYGNRCPYFWYYCIVVTFNLCRLVVILAERHGHLIQSSFLVETLKGQVKRFLDEGNDVNSADEFFNGAISHGGVPSVITKLCSVQGDIKGGCAHSNMHVFYF